MDTCINCDGPLGDDGLCPECNKDTPKPGHTPGALRAAWRITGHVGEPPEIASVPQTLRKFPAVNRALKIIERETALPELLAALEAIAKGTQAVIDGRVERFEACGVTLHLHGDALDMAGIRQMARAALAKTQP